MKKENETFFLINKAGWLVWWGKDTTEEDFEVNFVGVPILKDGTKGGFIKIAAISDGRLLILDVSCAQWELCWNPANFDRTVFLRQLTRGNVQPEAPLYHD